MTFGGATVPAGWMVMWAVTPSHVGHSVYSDPQKFVPDWSKTPPEMKDGLRAAVRQR